MNIFFFIFLCSCGPKYYFSNEKQPAWITNEIQTSASEDLQAVGISPLTSNVQNDKELAIRGAKAKIAAMFVSEVDSRLNMLTMTTEQNGKKKDNEILQNSVQVRSQVQVGDINVLGSFRDKKTKSHYVLVQVDKQKWSASLEKKLQANLKSLNSSIENVTTAKNNNEALKALQLIQKAHHEGAAVEQDLIVMDLLKPGNSFSEQIKQAKNQLQALQQEIAQRFPFYINVNVANPKLAKTLKGNIQQFLIECNLGYQVTDKQSNNAIKIEIHAGQDFVKEEQVGQRIEFLYAAQGEVTVIEPAGNPFTEMTIIISGKTYTSRGKSKEEGKELALSLASETLGSKFRSKFRQVVLSK